MKFSYSFLRWLVIFLSSCVMSAIIQHKGLFTLLWVSDLSGISFIILGIYLILTIFLGVLTHRLTTTSANDEVFQNNIVYLNGCWYTSELLMALGMMGTLIGFSVMLGPALAGLDPGNIITTKDAIFKMAAGMSTAVLTTLVGLVTSQLVKLQLINIETSLPKDENSNK